MNRHEFVSAIASDVYEVAVRDTLHDLRDAPGRQPSPEQLKLQAWFAQSDETTRTIIASIISLACDHAVFGFLAILDGVRTVESVQPKGTLQLYFQKGGTTVPLNGWTERLLHDVFRTIMASREPKVDADSKALDIHHVPSVEAGVRFVPEYDAQQAPAIALRTREHRNLPCEGELRSTFQGEVDEGISQLRRFTNVPDSKITSQ